MYPITFLWRSAERFPTRTALIDANGSLTFRELADTVVARAFALTILDPLPGSYVGIAAANSVDHLLTLLAVMAAGKVWVPLNPRNGDPELRRIVEFVKPSLVLADETMAARLAGIPTQLELLDVLHQPGAAVVEPAMGPRARAGVSLERAQAIKFTGGTTGTPKGVIQPLRAWNTNIVTQIHELGLSADDRYLVAAPITHGTGTYMLPLLGAGGALVFPDASTPAALLKAAAQHRATIFFAPPTLIQSLAEAQRHAAHDLSSLRYLVYGGAPMRPEQISAAQAVFGPVLCTSYGQTEAPQIITFMPPQQMHGNRLTSIGRPSLLTCVAVIDANGNPLPPGEEGEIAVRGDLVMGGYLNAEQETRQTLVDGWLRTGDAGVFDEQGFLYLRDRLRDVIITGGFNVYPSDVESVLTSHPAVADCAVVGIEDPKWGEAVHAAVRLRTGMQASADELISLVKRELGSVKTPKHIHFFDALPQSAVAKVLKPAVREAILNARQPS